MTIGVVVRLQYIVHDHQQTLRVSALLPGTSGNATTGSRRETEWTTDVIYSIARDYFLVPVLDTADGNIVHQGPRSQDRRAEGDRHSTANQLVHFHFIHRNGTHPLLFYGRELELEHVDQRAKVLNHLISLARAAIFVNGEMSELEPGNVAIPKAGEQRYQLRFPGGHPEADRFEVLAQYDRVVLLSG